MSTLSRPNLIARAVMLIAAVIAVILVVSAVGGSSSYKLNLALSDASGLRVGSQVLLGGVPVGTVKTLTVDRHNQVIAGLDLSRSDVHVGQGAKATIAAANLLGENYVALQAGDKSKPLPSGSTLPESATTLPTALDQVIDTLNGSTRAQLAELLDEAGTAVAGRQTDVGAILRQLPLSLTAATKLVSQLVQDNRTLSDTITNGDQFVSKINSQSGNVKSAIDSADNAVTTLSQQAGNLGTVVRGAPAALTGLDRFVVSLGHRATELIPATEDIQQATPPLEQVLGEIKPATKAAVPTLDEAVKVAPTLTRLAVRATPTVKAAVPTISSVRNLASLSGPLSSWAGLSSLSLLNTFGGWIQAVQDRDGAGHIFGAFLNLNVDVILNAADDGATSLQKRQNLIDMKNPALVRTLGLTAQRNADIAASGSPSGSGSPAAKTTSAPTVPTAGTTGKTTSGGSATGTPSTASGTSTPSAPTTTAGSGSGSVGSTLRGLLGGLLSGKKTAPSGTSGSTGSAAPSPGTTTTAAPSSPSSSGLSGLLGYLMGK